MALRKKEASEGKVFAYKDANNEEQILGNTLYLGINDDGERYYEVDAPKSEEEQVVETNEYVVEENKEEI